MDTRRLAVAGCSYGGIQTVLASEGSRGYRAAVNWFGVLTSSRSWRRTRRDIYAALERRRPPEVSPVG